MTYEQGKVIRTKLGTLLEARAYWCSSDPAHEVVRREVLALREQLNHTPSVYIQRQVRDEGGRFGGRKEK